MKNLWYCFGGATAPRPASWGGYGQLAALLLLLFLTTARPAGAQNAAANLDQIRNGDYASPQIPPDWVNGNAGAQQAHFLEGHSIAYRMVLSNLSAGAHTVIIGWDVRDGGKNALDFITHYQNLVPHGQFNHPAETVNPLDGLGLSSPSMVTFPIPAPAQIPALPSSFSFYQLQAAGKELLTLFNGTSIDNLQYVVQGDRNLAHAETQLAITFHTVRPTVVLAWGGHIGSQLDWGPGTSAVNINGSPYHTRVISLDGSGGNQDRSLSADAVAQPPTCAFTGPTSGCAGAPLTFSGPAGMSSYFWTVTGAGATPTSGTGQSITVTASSSYSIQLMTVKSGLTSSDNCQQAVTVNATTAATALTGLTRCPGTSATFSTTASGTGPFTYAWTKDGTPIAGATDASYTLASVSAADAGTYAVTVSGACGMASCNAALVVNEIAAATALTDLTLCPGTSATFSTTASGTGPFTYAWTKDGVPIAGATDASYTMAVLGLADAGTYAVTVTGLCNATTQTAALVVNSCSVQHCTLTQGGYGNGNGVICKYPGVRRTQLVADMLITDDVVLGVAGRSLTYSHTPGTSSAANLARLATAQCIIDKMPAGSTAAAFPSTMGNLNGCSALPNSLLKNGKFNNVLIGQTLALTLNARLDNTLSDVVLEPSMQSYATLNCTTPDPADLTGIVRTIPAAVLGNLSYLGNSPTVGSLLVLANKALGGKAYANAGGNPTAAEISGAAGAINELFDNCRMARGSSPVGTRPAIGSGAILVAGSSPGEDLHAYPNPFPATTTLEFALPQTTSYQLAVFDLKGREVVRVSSGEAQAGVRYSFPVGGSLLQEGIYVVRLVTAQHTQTIRLNLLH